MPLHQIFKSFNRKEKYIFGIALAVFLISLLSLLIFFWQSKTVAVPIASDEYIEGMVGQPTLINPLISPSNDVDSSLSEVVYSDLSELIDNYKVDESGKTWNISLKNDLKWSDNKPLTSDDIIYTFETILNPDSHSPLFQTWQGVVVERISELEVEFNLRNPYAFFFENLKYIKIVPKHIFGIIPPANLRLSDYNLEPVGSGPYKFASYSKRKDGFITDYNFTINENYSLDKPFIKNLIIKFYSNTEELIKAFNNKKIDGFGDLNPKNINEIKINHNIFETIMPRYYAIFFNLANNELLKDKNIRQALELASDREKITEQIFNGKAAATDQPLLSIIEGYNPEIKSLGFSIEKSKELLEKEGWVVNEETNIREKAFGKNIVKLEFNIIVPQTQFLIDAINIIKDDWQLAGIKLNPIILNPTDVNNQAIKNRDYQMIIFGNVLKLYPDLFSFWHSSEKFYPGLNLSIYGNKKVDELLERIRENFDNTSRKDQVGQLQSLINDDIPAIFLFSPLYLYVSPKNLGGFPESPITIPAKRFDNINKWYLKTARVFK